MHRPIRRVLVRRAHGKLIAVELAQNHRARRFQPSHRRAVIRRNKILQNFRTGSGAHAARHHHVFDRNRNSRQRRQRLALRGQRVDAPGLRQRPLFAKSQKRANLGIFLPDARVEIAAPERSPSSAALRSRSEHIMVNQHCRAHSSISQSLSALRKTSHPCPEHFSRRLHAAATCRRPSFTSSRIAYANRSLPCRDSSTP